MYGLNRLGQTLNEGHGLIGKKRFAEGYGFVGVS